MHNKKANFNKISYKKVTSQNFNKSPVRKESGNLILIWQTINDNLFVPFQPLDQLHYFSNVISKIKV